MTGRTHRRHPAGRRVLILLENLPLAKDPRVRRECRALLEAGYGVSVICPASHDRVPSDLADVRLHAYPAPREAHSWWEFAWEYVYSWAMTALLTVKVFARDGFDCIQACNPPDTSFLIALPFKALRRPFVFDHHDLTPEVFTARYGRTGGVVLRTLQLLERATYATADHVIATNESFRQVAVGRGGKAPDAVTVVRNGPDLHQAQPRDPRPELRSGRQHLCCWLGHMFVDDGVELALAAIAHLVHRLRRTDCHFAFVGDGAKRPALEALAEDLGVAGWVSFPGWMPLEDALAYLSTADIGLSPNPKSPRLDVSTSMKVMEYMALELPIVAFDVDETRNSAGDAAAYAHNNDPTDYARLIDELLGDPNRRAAMGKEGRARIEGGLAWDHQRETYVGVYDALLGSLSP